MSDSLPVLITVIVFASFGYLLSIGVLVFNIRYRNLRFVKMTSPKVNILLVLGTIILYTGCIIILLPTSSWSSGSQVSMLLSRNWLLTLGFTIMYGSMLVKGWRVHRLFQYSRTHTVTIKDISLFAGILVLIILDISLLLCWQFIDPLNCSTVPSNGSQVSTGVRLDDITSCTSHYYSVWLLVLLVYKYVILVLCFYIGWQIRHISFPALDDSKCLLLGSGLTLILSGSVCIVMLLFPNNQTAISSVMSFSLWFGTTALLVSTFSSKILVVLRSSGSEPLMCSASKYMQPPVSEDIGTELVRILGENKYLKRKLEERDTLVTQLKRQVSTPVNTDCDSQQTGSVNCSVISAPTGTSSSIRDRFGCFSLKYCLFSCLDDPDSSIKGNKGTPSPTRDINIKTVQVLTTPTIHEEQCFDYNNPLQNCMVTDENHMIGQEQASVIASHTSVNSCVQCAIPDQSVILSDVDYSMERIVLDPRDTSVTNSSKGNGFYMLQDIDLICTIADAYDLGGDSDTYSFISNCLYNNNLPTGSSRSLHRRNLQKRFPLNKAATLGSDQLYPDSISSLRPPPPSAKPSKKHVRRQSEITTANVYTNNKGDPLIL